MLKEKVKSTLSRPGNTKIQIMPKLKPIALYGINKAHNIYSFSAANKRVFPEFKGFAGVLY
jgi:hypothetical protein